MIDKPVINTDLKKCDKAYVVEDDILWEVFGDGYSQAEVIWDKENICELLNTLHQENQELQQKLSEKEEDERLYAKEIVKLNKDNQILKLGNDY